MGIKVVSEQTVLSHAQRLAKGSTKRLWITSPWVRQRAANLLLRDVLPRIENEKLDVRIVYRVKEPMDLNITELEALKAYEDAGCKVRYSIRLHAKVVLADSHGGIISSSNLTPTGGYSWVSSGESDWRNEELGVLVEDEPEALRDLETEFLRIWDAGTSVREDTLGIAMDFPTVESFNFVAIREVEKGQYVSTEDAEGRVILGRIGEITAYNRSFPQMSDSIWMTQYGGAGGGRHNVEIPDLNSLFSHPSKEHGFLVTKTFFEPESVFRIAKVNVLKHQVGGVLRSPTVPVAPGADVSRTSPALLEELLGGGDVELGAIHLHEDVPVRVRGSEILTKHMAVLGMTGSGKSNAVKVLIKRFLEHPDYQDLRIVVVDTHGEYEAIANQLAANPKLIDVALDTHVLDEDSITELAGLSRKDSALVSKARALYRTLPATATMQDYLQLVDAEAASAQNDKLADFAAGIRARNDVCLHPDEVGIIRKAGTDELEDLGDPGLYVLNLRSTLSMLSRSLMAAGLMRRLFRQKRLEQDQWPRTLVVLEEAQNYVPEGNVAWTSQGKPSYEAAFQLATEGRKFDVGLLISSQRPAVVNKAILAQCNSQMVFRVRNVEDLNAIKGSFEAASRSLLEELAGFDTGICIAGGTMLDMVVHVRVPLFED